MYSLSSSGALRRVPTPLVLVAGVHLVAIWALINGLQVHALCAMCAPPDTVATVVDSVPPPPETFTPPEVTVRNVTTTVVEPTLPPIPTDPVLTDLPPSPTADPASISTGGPGAVAVVPTPVVTGAAVDPRHPLTQPPYPMGAIRNNEEGALNLSVLVGTDGRVRDAKVAESSGSTRLDQAAVSEAKARWHLRPAMRDGVPFEQWLTLRVVFRLENR